MFKLFRFLKRLFEPAINTKTQTLKMMFVSFLSYFWWSLMPIISIPILIQYINNQDYDGIKKFSILILISYILIWSVHLFVVKWGVQSKFAFDIYITNKYLKKSILKDNTHIEKIGTGKIQSIVKSGMDSWKNVNNEILYSLVQTLFGISTGIYIILKFDFAYVPYFVLIVILSCTSYYYFRKIKLIYDQKANDIENNIDKDYVRIIMSRQEVVLAVNESKETNNIITLTEKQLFENVKSSKYDFLSDLSVSGVLTILPLIGVLFFTNSIELTPVNIAFLISFIYFCSQFTSIMYETVWVIRQVFENYPAIKKFWDFLDETPDFENYYKGKKFNHNEGLIEFKDIDFSYGEKSVLQNLNLKINGRQKVAFVGKSGSGKTTIAKLIIGFIEPQSGQVIVDNQDLKTISLNTYYKNIGYLTQEPMVFDGTVKENLLYSVDEKDMKRITDAKLFEVLKNAECDFITDLSTQIGEKGIRLSGGERQRLAIAKLMLKNPEIIILDEPTSALDSFSEDAITRALDKLFLNKTVIIIAHRLQTVKKADIIFVMEKGKIIEQGSSDELISKNGEYKKMVDLQSF